jgi:2-oxoglutarate dehydrogenase E1 component
VNQFEPRIEDLYQRFLRDPASVPAGWRRYFQEIEGTPREGEALEAAAPVAPAPTPAAPAQAPAASAPPPAPVVEAIPTPAPAPPEVETPPAPVPVAAPAPVPVPVAAPLAAPAPAAAPEPPEPEANPAAVAAFLPFIARVSLFRELPERDQRRVASQVQPLSLEAGQALFLSGDPADALYIVSSGSLRVERAGRVLAVVGPGEVTGEMALVDKQPRSADVVAHARASLLKLPAERFDALLSLQPEMARGLLQILAQRLRRANAQQEKVDQLARSFRNRGHVVAQLDPLGRGATELDELTLEYHGLAESELELPFSIATAQGTATLSLRAILEKLRNTYCRSIGVQFTHIEDRRVREWLQFRMEHSENRRRLSIAEQRHILAKLTDAEVFETFVQKKFLGAKRFSLEGGESLIPLLDRAIEEAATHGIQEIVIGMAHRGRLNVLANSLGKSPRRIFEEFRDADPEKYRGGGDVKYHLGFSSDRPTATGSDVHLSLCFNPSHLAVVGPVVLGRVRAKQDRLGDEDRRHVMGIVIHGDAAFAGQGVVQEMLNLTGLPGYRTGGALHVVVNNQIGFTTEPQDCRSGQYATDIARTLDTPVFHVNGEDPEAVVQAISLAMAFRAEFRRDVVVDMYCYRRHGHNEGDEPGYTQPLLYQRIETQPPVREGYLRRLREPSGVSAEEAQQIAESSVRRLEEELGAALSDEEVDEPELRSIWRPYAGGADRDTPDVDTGVVIDELSLQLQALLRVPEGFSVHPKLLRLMQQRREMAEGKRALDWAAGEALAFATLLSEGTHVRLSGQDSQRGTFTHRHAVLHDVVTGATHVPLHGLGRGQARFSVWNSPVSETAVLGFDWGYSLDTPEALVIWEAQFGDFANVAQAVIDQFVTSAEQKWNRLSGLVLLLPHGFEGQGPEHSSARLERFLASAARDNVQVVSPTTPAQIFHALRRQVVRPLRKPLVVMAPKSLLRHPAAVSPLIDLSRGSFQRVIPDASGTPAADARRLLLCAGKVYYDLVKAREERLATDTHILRLEQLYPFPDRELAEALSVYPPGLAVTWVQEEPRNMGAWSFLRLAAPGEAWGKRQVRCVARAESASPATGSASAHRAEQSRLIEKAFAVW